MLKRLEIAVAAAVMLAGSVFVASLSGGGSAFAASQSDWDDCNGGNVERKISGCTRVIEDPGESVANRALAYSRRALLWSMKGDGDRSIADYGEAIRLNPTDVDSYKARGLRYLLKGDNDRAIGDYSEAIRLNPRDAEAFERRIGAYWAKGDLDRAIADLTAMIGLDPTAARTYGIRGGAYQAKGDNDRAAADYGEAIRLDPKDVSFAFARGLLRLYGGSVDGALADFTRAYELDPKSGYVALWLDIAARRSGLASRLSEAVPKMDMTAWPAPVVRLFLGQMTQASLLAAADNPDPRAKSVYVCDTNFFGGMVALRQGATDEASRLFRLAASDCPRGTAAGYAAAAELKALGVKP